MAKIGKNPDFSTEKNLLYFQPAIPENRCCTWLGGHSGQAEKEVRVKIVYPNLPDTQKMAGVNNFCLFFSDINPKKGMDIRTDLWYCVLLEER